MIRRMKKEALADGGGLPPKIREYVKVAVDPTWGVEIDAALKEKEVRFVLCHLSTASIGLG
jgi:hypothetical protein